MESITSGRTIITHNDESPLNFNNDLIIKQTIKRLSNQALKSEKRIISGIQKPWYYAFYHGNFI